MTSQNETCGVSLIKAWSASRPVAQAVPEPAECGIDIVRSFMNQERAEFGWPGSSITKLSKPRRIRSTPTPKQAPRMQSSEDDHQRMSSDDGDSTWRRHQGQTPTQVSAYNKEQHIAPCNFFFSPAGCRFGPDCRFSHEQSSLDQAQQMVPHQPVMQMAPCPYFMAGFCRYGEQCLYAHLNPEEIEAQYYMGQPEQGDFSDGEWNNEDDNVDVLEDSSNPGFSTQSESNSEESASEESNN